MILLDVESKKKNESNELIYRTETASQTSKTNFMVTKGETWRGGINWDSGMNLYTRTYCI